MTDLERYAMLLESLNADNLERLRSCTADNIQFSDPFSRVQGRDAYLALLADMFDRLDEVGFELHELVEQGGCGYLYWTFRAQSRLTGPFHFEGVSRIELDANGQVCRHQDFWDASELLARLPLLGGLLRPLKRRFAYRPEVDS